MTLKKQTQKQICGILFTWRGEKQAATNKYERDPRSLRLKFLHVELLLAAPEQR